MEAQWKDAREAPQVRVRELPAQLGPGGQQPVLGNRSGRLLQKTTLMDTWRAQMSRKKRELLAGSPQLSHELREQRAGLPREEGEQPGKKMGRAE